MQAAINLSCHGGCKKAFTIGDVQVWGSDRHGVNDVPDPILLHMDLCDDNTEPYIKFNASARLSFKHTVKSTKSLFLSVPSLHIDWQDRAGVDLPLPFWKALVQDLKGKKGNVVISCFGGHGRTGTALVILAWAAQRVPKGQDAIVWLRKQYCEDAVESTAQIKSLQEMHVRTKVKEESYIISGNWKGKWERTVCKGHGCYNSLIAGEVDFCATCLATNKEFPPNNDPIKDTLLDRHNEHYSPLFGGWDRWRDY